MDKEREYGIVERGKVSDVTANGYSISSLDRDGITTPPIQPVEYGQSGVTVPTYAAGDMVYYFIFKDGTGRIICAV